MKLTKVRFKSLIRWDADHRVWVNVSHHQEEMPGWSYRNQFDLAHELVKWAAIGFDAHSRGLVSGEMPSDLGETDEESTIRRVKRYREGAQKGWRTKKRLAAIRATEAAKQDVGKEAA